MTSSSSPHKLNHLISPVPTPQELNSRHPNAPKYLPNPFQYPYDYTLLFQYRGYKNTPDFLVKRFLKGCQLGFQLYLPIHLLPILLFKRNRLKSPSQWAPLLKNLCINLLRSCLFISSLQTMFLLVLLYAKKVLNGVDHPLSVALSGFTSGLSIIFEKPQRRLELGLYCVPRCIEILHRYLKFKQAIPLSEEKERWAWCGIFCLSVGVLMAVYQKRKEVMKPSMRALIGLLIGE